MKQIKGEYGYLRKKKIRQFLKVLLCGANIIFLLLLGIYIAKSRNNLLTILAVVFCLPLANFAATLITVFPYRSGDEKRYREFQKAAEGLLTSYDMVMTSKELVLPVSFGVIHENGIFLYGEPKGKWKKPKEAEDFVERMLRANNEDASVHIFQDWQPFLRRLSSLNRTEGEPSEKLFRQKAVLLAISI